MKRKAALFLAFTIGAGVLLGGFTGLAAEPTQEEPSYGDVASEEEQVKPREVGVEGMFPVYGKDIKDGVYEVTVESSSSMFRVEEARLTVRDGEMQAELTLSGTGYLKLFLGTGAQAAASGEASYIGYVEKDSGKYSYTIPVEALDQPIACAAFSRNREKWYDRSILFEASSLPADAVLVELPDYEALEREAKEKRIAALRAEPGSDAEKTEEIQPMLIEMEDGDYAIEVELSGGTGRTTVNSPAGLLVRDGCAYARIEWSSSSYDYMKIGGQKYLPIQEEGYSTFEIPITAFNEPVEVIADTTAMSTPHEITYQLTFLSEGIMSKNQTPQAAAQRMVYMVFVIIGICAVVSFVSKKRRNAGR